MIKPGLARILGIGALGLALGVARADTSDTSDTSDTADTSDTTSDTSGSTSDTETTYSVSDRAGEDGGCDPGGAKSMLMLLALPLAAFWRGRRTR